MKREIYSCDICGYEHPPTGLLGLRFTGTQDFNIKDARSTDGKHLCLSCARQLSAKLPAALSERAN